jgi:hypothetical protein
MLKHECGYVQLLMQYAMATANSSSTMHVQFEWLSALGLHCKACCQTDVMFRIITISRSAAPDGQHAIVAKLAERTVCRLMHYLMYEPEGGPDGVPTRRRGSVFAIAEAL